jgi:hypothetical protein|tara:strand:+ start:333 stop:722 length:390 start_codon:yes stop_codon:yes gene_type:complete
MADQEDETYAALNRLEELVTLRILGQGMWTHSQVISLLKQKTELVINEVTAVRADAKAKPNRRHSNSGVSHRRTHCVHGHEYTPENSFTNRQGGRECNICRKKKSARTTEQRRLKRNKEQEIWGRTLTY